jgi:hypothetical protein
MPAQGRLESGDRAHFQSEAGDWVFFAEESAELGARACAARDAQAAWLRTHLSPSPSRATPTIGGAPTTTSKYRKSAPRTAARRYATLRTGAASSCRIPLNTRDLPAGRRLVHLSVIEKRRAGA